MSKEPDDIVLSLAAGLGYEAERRQPKWPGRVTSSTTECAHAHCPNQKRCWNGCVDQQPITWAANLIEN
jgi:hypothetical protein